MIPVDILDEYLNGFTREAKRETLSNDIELSNCCFKMENENRLNFPESQLSINVSTASLGFELY